MRPRPSVENQHQHRPIEAPCLPRVRTHTHARMSTRVHTYGHTYTGRRTHRHTIAHTRVHTHTTGTCNFWTRAGNWLSPAKPSEHFAISALTAKFAVGPTHLVNCGFLSSSRRPSCIVWAALECSPRLLQGGQLTPAADLPCSPLRPLWAPVLTPDTQADPLLFLSFFSHSVGYVFSTSLEGSSMLGAVLALPCGCGSGGRKGSQPRIRTAAASVSPPPISSVA